MEASSKAKPQRFRIRWWPGVLLILIILTGILWARSRGNWPFQQRNVVTAEIIGVGAVLFFAWWIFFSRASKRTRTAVLLGVFGMVVAFFGLFRFLGVDGDLVPVFETRWRTLRRTGTNATAVLGAPNSHSFPQFYGPNRNGILTGPALSTNWVDQPPAVVWRLPVGSGWSGFSVAGRVCVTQEQVGESECVVARDLASGAELWRHLDRASFGNPVAGEGPRATPAIAEGQVITLGSSGLLNCLELGTGKPLWQRDVIRDSGGKVPTWGVASSPLVLQGTVVVHGGQSGFASLLAYRIANGTPLWQGGTKPSYSTPMFAVVAGVPQILAFNDGSVSGHDPLTGATLWERGWGNGNVVCSMPVVVSSDRILFSSGYGVGSELIGLSLQTAPHREGDPAAARHESRITTERIWKSQRLKSKFGHLFVRDGSVYGLDDGILACVNAETGEQRWKEGRYGHGQGLLVGQHYLLMSERGELILLNPSPAGPCELARFRVFDSKTWNPLALVGNLLLVRNDREAACLRVPTIPDSGRN